MFVDRAVRRAEVAFLNAPFADAGWNDAIRLLAEATGSALGQLCGGGMGPGLTFNLLSEDRHDPHGYLVDPQLYGPENWRINCTMGGPRSVQDERHYAAYRSSNPTTFYDDAVSDLDLPYGCQSPLMLDSGGLVGLALLRSSRDGPCTPDIIAVFTRIARQAHRAVLVQYALGQQRGEAMLAGLATSGEMTLLLDRSGGLVALTPAAERMFDCPLGLRLDGSNVRLSRSDEDQALTAAIGRLLASDGYSGPVVHQATVGRSDEHPGGLWELFLTRLPARCDLIGVEAQIAMTLRPLLTP
jgi:hypothetical protein